MPDITFKKDKVCKNSVRYTADEKEMADLGVFRQKFSVYVPTELLKDIEVGADLKISISAA